MGKCRPFTLGKNLVFIDCMQIITAGNNPKTLEELTKGSIVQL